MANPYEPPGSEPSLSSKSRNRSFYFGGYPAVGLLGVAIGIVVGLWMEARESPRGYIPPVLPAAVGWLVAICAIVVMIQRTSLTAAQRIFLVICLPLPCYILFVPVCTINANFAPSTTGYPLASLWVLACGSAFPMVLLLVAAILRVCVRWLSGKNE